MKNALKSRSHSERRSQVVDLREDFTSNRESQTNLTVTKVTLDEIEAEHIDVPTFAELGLGEKICEAVDLAGYAKPTDIQLKVVPTVLSRRDVIGQAQTGSGKTAAYSLPALEMLMRKEISQVLVLVPTRELASQVVAEFQRFKIVPTDSIVPVVGGAAMYRQIELINRGAKVIVATPGRILDHLRSERIKQFAPTLVVLDEADEMLDMGFIDDVKTILKTCAGGKRQTLLFSATMPDAIRRLSAEVLNEPQHIVVGTAGKKHEDIAQFVFVVNEYERTEALVRLLKYEEIDKAIIFCRTKKDVDILCEVLDRYSFQVIALHGDLNQNVRNQSIKSIKEGKTNILVATDVAARGLDISDISHVFNYHLPDTSERYTHRIGRTGRAGQKGKALTLLTPTEYMGFEFQRHYRVDQIIAAAVPTKAMVSAKVEKKLINDITNLPLNARYQNLAKTLLTTMDAETAVTKLLTAIHSEFQLSSRENVGLDPSEIDDLKNRSRNRGGSSSGRSWGRNSGGGGGRSYSNRSSSGGGGRWGQSSGGDSSQGGGGYRGKRSFSSGSDSRSGGYQDGGARRQAASPPRGSKPSYRQDS